MADHVSPPETEVSPAPARSPDPIAPEPPSAQRSQIRWRDGLIAVGLVVLGGFIGLTFFNSETEDPLRGTVQFGTGPSSGCSVTYLHVIFEPDDPVYLAAHLAREVPAGQSVTVRVLRDGAEVESTALTFDEDAGCVTGSMPAATLGPGHYRLEYLAGSELLAQGEFSVGE